MIHLINTKENWEAILSEIGSYDFYHTYDYHEISKNENETPILLVFREGTTLIALPLLLRAIEGTSLFDATSVYGYAGPIARITSDHFNQEAFHNGFISFLKKENIIAVFSRLNPYIKEQTMVLQTFGGLHEMGKVVNIDLTKTLDEQRSAYRRDTRSRVNKARRTCTVKKATSDEEIRSFIGIYNETMKKLEASDSYYFKEQYFFDFLNCKGFETDILLAIHNETGETIAGTMFVKTNNIIQYHLSGTKTEYLKVAPSRLLLDEMRILGTEEGYMYFNLGGGYQSKEDALFNFKSSFSEDIRPFKVWKYIADKESYDALVKNKGIDQTEFFPAYRAPQLNPTN